MARNENYVKDLEQLRRINAAITFIEENEFLDDTQKNVLLRAYLEDTFYLDKSYITRNLKTGEFEHVVLINDFLDIELSTYENWIINNLSGAKVDLEYVDRINGLFELYG